VHASRYILTVQLDAVQAALEFASLLFALLEKASLSDIYTEHV